MTEKEKTLDMVVRNFMANAEEMAKSKDPFVAVNARQGYWAAIETAGWGASTETIDWAVRKYLKNSKVRLFGHDNFKLAIDMTLKGASKKAAEEVLAVAVKYYSWIWPVKQLTAYLGRHPKEEEILGIVRAEVANMATLSESYHEELVQFAEKYLLPPKIREIKSLLEEKTREFFSHSD